MDNQKGTRELERGLGKERGNLPDDWHKGGQERQCCKFSHVSVI